MKKRTILFLLLLILCSSITVSCGKEKKDYSNVYNPNTDCQYQYIPQGTTPSIAETKDGYYFLAGFYLYYVDKQSRKPVILCDKPNCLHNEETDPEKILNCNAVFPSINPCLIYYSDDLYIASSDSNAAGTTYSLYKVSLDGIKRKKVIEFGKNMPNSIIIHRGTVYYATTVYDKKGNSIYGIKKYELNKFHANPEQIYTGKLPDGNIQDILCYGKNLYFKESCFNEKMVASRCMRVDLETGITSRIMSNNDKEVPSFSKILNNHLLYSISQVNETNGNVIDMINYMSDLDGHNAKVSFKTEIGNINISDRKYLYSYAIPWAVDTGGKNVLSVYDTKGKVLDKMDITLNKTGKIIGGGDKYLFIMDYANEKYKISTIDKSAIGSGSMKQELLFEIDENKLTPAIITRTK